jgi:predicted GTPase
MLSVSNLIKHTTVGVNKLSLKDIHCQYKQFSKLSLKDMHCLLGNHEVDFKTLLRTISRAEKPLCLDHLEQQESCVYLLKRRGV